MNSIDITARKLFNNDNVKLMFVSEVLDHFGTYEYEGMRTPRENVFAQVSYMYNGITKYPLETICLKLANSGSYCLYATDDIVNRMKQAFPDAEYRNAEAIYKSLIALAIKEICNEFKVKPGDSLRFFEVAMTEKYIDHHDTDLYVKKTFVSDFIVGHLSTRSLLDMFYSHREPCGVWYELPFCYIAKRKEA